MKHFFIVIIPKGKMNDVKQLQIKIKITVYLFSFYYYSNVRSNPKEEKKKHLLADLHNKYCSKAVLQ